MNKKITGYLIRNPFVFSLSVNAAFWIIFVGLWIVLNCSGEELAYLSGQKENPFQTGISDGWIPPNCIVTPINLAEIPLVLAVIAWIPLYFLFKMYGKKNSLRQ